MTFTVIHLRRLVVCLALAAALSTLAIGARQGDAPSCDLSTADAGWIQGALDGWSRVSREFLRVDDRPLQWTLLFDTSCLWHLSPGATVDARAQVVATSLTFGGAPVAVRAQRHRGTMVQLPNGADVPIAVKASTALYRNGRVPFLVMSLPVLWATDPHYARSSHRSEYLQGIMIHEMTHTRQLVAINRQIRELARTTDLPLPINDDVVQARFRRAAGFERVFRQERDFFYQAAAQKDPVKQRALARRALDLVHMRHARYFSGTNKAYAQIESLFLTMEGAGQWAAYRFATLHSSTSGGSEEPLAVLRQGSRAWSEDEGLALFLLLDALVPSWQEKIFAATPASPLELLDAAISR
jgi:hypothetical protein